MTASALLRPAVLNDIPKLIQLAGETPKASQWTERQYTDIIRGYEKETARRIIIVSAAELTVFGYAVISTTAYEAELENVVVSGEFRRQGIAHRLCVDALKWAQEQGAEQVWLEVRESNSPARHLYVGLGFEEAGRRVRYYRDPDEDAVIMRWRA